MDQQVQKDPTQRTVLHCPRCSHEFRREYVPAAALKEARDLLWTIYRAWHAFVDAYPDEVEDALDIPEADALDNAANYDVRKLLGDPA